MSLIQKHGITELQKAVEAAENKRKGITGDAEKVRKDLQVIMDIVNNPVPDRRIKDYE